MQQTAKHYRRIITYMNFLLGTNIVIICFDKRESCEYVDSTVRLSAIHNTHVIYMWGNCDVGNTEMYK